MTLKDVDEEKIAYPIRIQRRAMRLTMSRCTSAKVTGTNTVTLEFSELVVVQRMRGVNNGEQHREWVHGEWIDGDVDVGYGCAAGDETQVSYQTVRRRWGC